MSLGMESRKVLKSRTLKITVFEAAEIGFLIEMR